MMMILNDKIMKIFVLKKKIKNKWMCAHSQNRKTNENEKKKLEKQLHEINI